MTNDPRGRWLGVFGLAAFILVASFDTLAKYFGATGIALYSVLGLIAIFAGYQFIWPVMKRSVSEKTGLILAGLTFLWLIIETAVGYPLANSGRFGPGSDVDDALVIGAGAILNGEYPYYFKTYLGLALSPLPGSLVLAIPWVVIGAIQFQNVFWLGVLFLLLRDWLRSSVPAVGLFWAMLVLSPTVHQSLVTGSDYIANTIFVLAAGWLVLRYAANDASPWKKLLAASLLGLSLSSRTNFLLLLPILFISLVRLGGLKDALLSSAAIGVGFAIVTLPFWAFDPQGFTPLTTQAVRVKLLDEVLPYSGKLIPAAAAVIGVVLALRSNPASVAHFVLNNGVVQLFLVLATSIIYAVQTNQLNLFMGNSGYGLFGLFFGASGCWLLLNEAVPARQEHANGE